MFRWLCTKNYGFQIDKIVSIELSSPHLEQAMAKSPEEAYEEAMQRIKSWLIANKVVCGLDCDRDLLDVINHNELKHGRKPFSKSLFSLFSRGMYGPDKNGDAHTRLVEAIASLSEFWIYEVTSAPVDPDDPLRIFSEHYNLTHEKNKSYRRRFRPAELIQKIGPVVTFAMGGGGHYVSKQCNSVMITIISCLERSDDMLGIEPARIRDAITWSEQLYMLGFERIKDCDDEYMASRLDCHHGDTMVRGGLLLGHDARLIEEGWSLLCPLGLLPYEECTRKADYHGNLIRALGAIIANGYTNATDMAKKALQVAERNPSDVWRRLLEDPVNLDVLKAWRSIDNDATCRVVASRYPLRSEIDEENDNRTSERRKGGTMKTRKAISSSLAALFILGGSVFLTSSAHADNGLIPHQAIISIHHDNPSREFGREDT